MNIKNNKLICYSKKYYIYSRGPKLYISGTTKETKTRFVQLPVSALKSLLGSFRLSARALRLNPRCGIFVDDTIALVSYHGEIYRINCASGEIALEHHFRQEMNNPLSFVQIKDVPGFTDGIYYGEYYLNKSRNPIRIYRRNKDASWEAVYTFPAGSIYHIHTIVPCPKKACVYVLTGDEDAESAIYECKNDFAEVKPIVQGKQSFRACVALPTQKGLLYTTDTPLEDNYLYHLDFDTKEVKKVLPLSGPSIYSKVLSDTEMVFSTTVESDSRLPRWRYEFSWKLGPGVKDRYSRIYHVQVNGDDIKCKEIFRIKKDIIPGGCGQMGTLMFPVGEGSLFVTGQSVRKYDNKTFSIGI
ncbi:MAG: hypothetical protein IKP29_02565 [Pseudobutyrivibrio sp.]|nr:hypothetical protein [Pseudobutyrivibrio sp.]